MEQDTAIQYKALNENSYNRLAAYAVTLPATVTLNPEFLVIVIPENAAKEVGEFIDNEGLDFHIEPIEVDSDNVGELIDDETTDASSLRKICYILLEEKRQMALEHNDVLSEITKERDSVKMDRDHYRKWWSECNTERDRVKKQIGAIAVLSQSIFPDK